MTFRLTCTRSERTATLLTTHNSHLFMNEHHDIYLQQDDNEHNAAQMVSTTATRDDTRPCLSLLASSHSTNSRHHNRGTKSASSRGRRVSFRLPQLFLC